MINGIIIATGGIFFLASTVAAISGAPFAASVVTGFVLLIACGVAGVWRDIHEQR